MSLLTTVARKGYYNVYFLPSYRATSLHYRAINCNLSHDKENGKLHVGKTVMPDDETHVGWIKTLDPKFKYLFHCTLFTLLRMAHT